MTNDKDGAALLREALAKADEFAATCPLPDRFPFADPYRHAFAQYILSLKSHGQAFDAAGVREACAKEAERYYQAYPKETICDTTAREISAAIRALPIPEAPASVEPVAGIIIPKIDPVHAERHPVLAPIIEKRALAAANFSPEFSGQRGQDFDRGLLCAFEAVNGQLQRMTQESALPEPDTIGSHFGNGGGLDPVRSFHVGDCEASPGFGGGDLREALRDMPDQIFQSIAESKTAATCRERVAAMIAALPPVKQSVGKFQRGDHVEKISGSKWRGKIVGEYATELTPEGYAVESDTETGSVQIYPAKALRPFADCCDQIADTEDDEEWAKFRLLIKDYRRASQALEASR